MAFDASLGERPGNRFNQIFYTLLQLIDFYGGNIWATDQLACIFSRLRRWIQVGNAAGRDMDARKTQSPQRFPR